MNRCRAIKASILIAIGGALYAAIEVAYRGYTHPTMFLVGGLAFYAVGLINELLGWETPFILQALLAGAIITAMELASGCVLNFWLGLAIWDYADVPYNLWGQICPQFAAVWVLLGAVGIVLDDVLRWRLFGEDKPRYKLI